MVGVDAHTRRWWAWLSSALAITTTVAYIALISAEGDDSFWEVFPWVILMLVGTGAALTSALVRDRAVGRAFAIGGAVVLGLIGLVAILSIGVGFVLAAVAAGVAAVTTTPTGSCWSTGTADACSRTRRRPA
jgi:hypothetical protein